MHWKHHTPRKNAAIHYAREFSIDELTAQILLNRGFNGIEVIRDFLTPSMTDLHDPFAIKGMDRAVQRIRSALVSGERIHVHGDYDVDGITATSVVMSTLRALGANVDYHIINRGDASVGLTIQSLERDHLPHKPSLIITVDCGTSSHAAIEYAMLQDVDVIVVDHHMPGPTVPRCVAVLNPMQEDCGFAFKHLAAVGVAFCLAQALVTYLEGDDRAWPHFPLEQLTDLVALGTISDLVPLTDQNRILVRAGMDLLRSAKRPGICALMRSARLLKGTGGDVDEPITARTVGFRLAPLLNAAGRMNDANKCVELLITDSYRSADAITRDLQNTNVLRQSAEREVLQQALAEAEELVAAGAPALILARAGWHPGVLGIVASRLVERFHRPALVASIAENGTAKGSVRSPDTVDMLAALSTCHDLLDTYGGHKVAAGVAFPAPSLESLRTRLAHAVTHQLPSGDLPEREIEVDAVLNLDCLTPRLVSEFETLAPFGAANPEPVFEVRRVQPVHAKALGGGNVRVRFRQGATVVDAFGYGFARRLDEIRRSVDVVFSPRVVRHERGDAVEMVIRDFTRAR